MSEKVLLGSVIAVVIVGILYFAIRQRRASTTYVIGQQLAYARSNEQARLNLGNAAPSPLPNRGYTEQRGEWGLLNPGPSEFDAELRTACKTFRALSKQERAEFTSAISLEEFYTLMLFAKRAAVFALRNQDSGLLRDGLIAAAMIQAKRTDFRDILQTLALLHHTASRIGIDPDALLREASSIAEPGVADLMTGFAGRDARQKSLKDSWGYVEVETPFGRGFAQWGFKPFAPTTDLLAMAMRIASIIDADSYHTDSIELGSELPAVWLRDSQSSPLDETISRVRAGATVSAQLQAEKHANASSQQFTVFVVEMDSPESAQVLLKLSQTKASGDFSGLGTAEGRIFCLVIARSFVQGVASFETRESLDRFEKPMRDALKQAAF